MAKTIVRLFRDFSVAQKTVRDLQDSGIWLEDISLVANDSAGVRHGGALITVHASDDTAQQVAQILERHDPEIMRGHGTIGAEDSPAERIRVPYDINAESTSLEDQVDRLRVQHGVDAYSGDATRAR